MTIKKVLTSVTAATAAVLAVAGLLVAQDAAATGQTISNSVPGLVKVATNVGVTDTTQVIDVVIWLKIRDQAGLDALAADLYNPASASYHKWITPADFANSYAPTAQNAKTIEQFFSANGLSVVEVGPKNLYVRARGSVANVNKAFQVKLNNFDLKGQTYFANPTAPSLASAAAALTAAVYGLDNLQYAHPYVTQTPAKGPADGAPPAAAPPGAPPFSSVCFSGPETLSFNNAGTFPFVTLKGNGYSTTTGSQGCGYTPPEIHAAYNLTGLYNEGFDGTGQTIVIIDWCGSPTIKADANTFSAAYGLPPLTSANFRIINSSTPPTCGAPDPEINIDVEWAHAIAPGANIDLVVPPSASFADVDTAEYFAIINGLGSVISGSYGSEELYDSPAELQTESLINEIAAVQGMSANFSTGDSGDFTFGFFPASVSAPADSPYATGVGGVSLALNSDNTIAWQTGWGTNINTFRFEGSISDPPIGGFFDFGSGGGPSAVFAKPSYQSKLTGTQRLLPDISWLADPYTGGVIVISEPFQYPHQIYTVYGGTSLACPMFSALWAIANQEAGAPLGQAAQYVYAMPKSAITDVLPIGSTTNVRGTYKESATVTDTYTAADLAEPLELTTKFYSALWAYPLTQDTTYLVTFGTDSGLTTTKGWDNVTGVGTPNGQAFADYFKP
jgi:subtilase family serine protease